METNVALGLVARIYDTALDGTTWPVVLSDLAHAIGASGAMIFEVTKMDGSDVIACPYQSTNYDPEIVNQYLAKHNAQEMIDQARFAEISGEGTGVKLVNDTEFPMDMNALRAQGNVQDMLEAGLCHRSGALLNKDSWQIDRFAFQFRQSRGPADLEETKAAELLLPHVAKALRIGRPLGAQDILDAASTGRASHFGLCLLSPKGFPIAKNAEFDRIVAETAVFQTAKSGHVSMAVADDDGKYQALIASDDIHGQAGAHPRRQSIFFPLQDADRGIFVEICPASDHKELGRLPPMTRLITVMDSRVGRALAVDVVSRFFPLTPSESDVLVMVGEGLTNREIAVLRGRSLETVNSQVKTLFVKTHTRNRTELVQLSLSLAAPFSK